MSEAMTKIIESPADILTPAEVSKTLRCSAQWLRMMARQKPDQLPFPVMVVGRNVKIPRRPFLAYMGISPEDGEKVSAPSDPNYATQNGGVTG